MSGKLSGAQGRKRKAKEEEEAKKNCARLSITGYPQSLPHGKFVAKNVIDKSGADLGGGGGGGGAPGARAPPPPSVHLIILSCYVIVRFVPRCKWM